METARFKLHRKIYYYIFKFRYLHTRYREKFLLTKKKKKIAKSIILPLSTCSFLFFFFRTSEFFNIYAFLKIPPTTPLLVIAIPVWWFICPCNTWRRSEEKLLLYYVLFFHFKASYLKSDSEVCNSYSTNTTTTTTVHRNFFNDHKENWKKKLIGAKQTRAEDEAAKSKLRNRLRRWKLSCFSLLS